MKTLIISISIAIMAIITFEGCQSTKVTDSTRDLAYEQYCDSIWEANPEYYDDVLAETDEYQDYLEEHGKWW
jgi:hypothetical protein